MSHVGVVKWGNEPPTFRDGAHVNTNELSSIRQLLSVIKETIYPHK